MHLESPTPTALDRSIQLATSIAALLAEAEQEANTSLRTELGTLTTVAVPLRRLREVQAGIADRLLARLAPRFDAAWVELEAIDVTLTPRDRRVSVAAWRSLVQPYFLRVPFARRSIDKPLGYPGDYGMVNFIYDAPDGAADPLGAALERYTWDVGPCRAHRQRRPWSLAHLASVRAQLGRPLRVVSYACGPEHTLQAWAETDPDTRIDLYDAEPRALEWCTARFGELGHRLGRPLSVRTHRVSPSALGDGSVNVAAPADVILVLGLFDYLNAEGIGQLVDTLVAALGTGGRLLCTNLNRPNPWRVFMDYLGGWAVEHRTKEQLVAEVVRGRGDLRVLDARLDDSGTNAFVAVERLDAI